MRGGGIPPSLDRRDRVIGRTIAGVVLFAFFLGVMVVVLKNPERLPASLTDPPQDSEARLEAYLAEKERASAYAFVRDHLDQRSKEPGIAAVYCRDCRHRWIGEHIEFQGDVDFVLTGGGRVIGHTYTAVLTGSSKDGWTLVSIDVQPDNSGMGR